MAEQEVGERLGVGVTSKAWSRQTPLKGQAGDVADRVAAGFARGDAHGAQAAHDGGRIFDVDEVELDVLARGDVGDAVGVLFGRARRSPPIASG